MFARLARFAPRIRRTAALAAAVLLGAAARPAHAQATGVLRFDEGGQLAFTSEYGPTDVGRLRGTFLSLPGQTSASLAVDLFCVDIPHAVTFDPNGWSVYLTNLGGLPSLDYTRQGARYADGTPDALTRYRKAAWLVDQYARAKTVTDTAGIQGAMWRQFESSLAPYTYASAGEEQSVDSWLTKADTFAASSRFDTYNWGRFTIVTDVNAAGMGDDYHGWQELITRTPLTTTTPEPGSIALVAVGLAGVGAVVRRRRGAAAA